MLSFLSLTVLYFLCLFPVTFSLTLFCVLLYLSFEFSLLFFIIFIHAPLTPPSIPSVFIIITRLFLLFLFYVPFANIFLNPIKYFPFLLFHFVFRPCPFSLASSFSYIFYIVPPLFYFIAPVFPLRFFFDLFFYVCVVCGRRGETKEKKEKKSREWREKEMN